MADGPTMIKQSLTKRYVVATKRADLQMFDEISGSSSGSSGGRAPTTLRD